MTKDEIIQISMEIIMAAGNARNAINNSVDLFINLEYEKSDEALFEAKKFIDKGHVEQTKVVQAELEKDDEKVTLLFTHAQDSLMTVYSEYHNTNRMKKMFKILMDKIGGMKNE